MTAPVGQAPSSTELKKPERKEMIWTKEEKDTLKSKYGTEILVAVSYTHLTLPTSDLV